MIDTSISIPVDAETARAYRDASAEVQKKIQVLLLLRLRELSELPKGSLAEIMDDIGSKAVGRGLNPAILKSLLDDE